MALGAVVAADRLNRYERSHHHEYPTTPIASASSAIEVTPTTNSFSRVTLSRAITPAITMHTTSRRRTTQGVTPRD